VKFQVSSHTVYAALHRQWAHIHNLIPLQTWICIYPRNCPNAICKLTFQSIKQLNYFQNLIS
jgi:hypothetical protein